MPLDLSLLLAGLPNGTYVFEQREGKIVPLLLNEDEEDELDTVFVAVAPHNTILAA